MPEVLNYAFTHKELAELMIKKQDLHEGHWCISIEFGLGAANLAAGPEDSNMFPTAIVPVKRIGIQRHERPNQLTVDAAEVNPVVKKAQKKKENL